MTALPGYELLEAAGDYVEREGGLAREVLLKFGDASLTIMRFDETPLAHWPLATLRFVVDSAGVMTIAPDSLAPERLMVRDRDMVAAIRAVCLEPSGPKPPPRARSPWPRRLLWLALSATAIGLVVWRPPAVMDRIAAFAPPEARAALGEAAIREYAGGGLCAPEAEARRALQALAARLSPGGTSEGPITVAVADIAEPPAPAVMAPGGRALLFRRTIQQGPAAVAEALALAMARAERRQPTTEALRAGGVAGVLGALSGDLRYGGLASAAAQALAAPDLTADDAVRAALTLESAGIGASEDPFTASGWRAVRRACGP